MRSYEESQYNLRFSEFRNKEDRSKQINKMEAELIQHEIRIETEIGEKKKKLKTKNCLMKSRKKHFLEKNIQISQI